MASVRKGLTPFSISQELERQADKYESWSSMAGAASIFAAVVVFAMALTGLRLDLFVVYAGKLKPLEEVALSGIFGTIVAVVFDKASSYFQLEGRRWRDKATQLNIERIVRSSFNAEIVGDPDESVGILARQISSARTVKNTFVNLGGAPSAQSSTEQAILAAYGSFFEANPANRWHDVVSINEFYGFRHLQISPKATGKNQHQIHVLGVNTPIMNFIIIEPWGVHEVTEVYFGWLYGAMNGSHTIFKSRNPEIVDLFDNYFKILCDASEDALSVDYSIPPEEREQFSLIKKSGYWLTVSYNDEGRHDFGIIRVHFKDNKPIVEGGIWDKKGTIRTIRHTDVVLYRDKIYFEYKQTSKGRKVNGFCIYEFVIVNGRDSIEGYYQDDGDEPRYKLAGFRLSGRKDYEDIEAFHEAIAEKEPEIALRVPGGARGKKSPPAKRKRGASPEPDEGAAGEDGREA